MKRQALWRRLVRASAAVLAIWIVAMIVGFVIDGIGIAGLIATFFLMAVAFLGLLLFPRMSVPSSRDLAATPLPELAARTELFLDAQRNHLSARAQDEVDRIGLRLDALSPQLASIGEHDGIASDARSLLGEHLPKLLDSFIRLPVAMRGQGVAGSTPEEQLVDGLRVVEREIEAISQRIAKGELDALATRHRYLETRYSAPEDLDGA